jgi:hypothetical protein
LSATCSSEEPSHRRCRELQDTLAQVFVPLLLGALDLCSISIRTFAPGYREIRVKFKVKGDDADEATIQELVRKSPVYDTLANPVKITIDVEKV